MILMRYTLKFVSLDWKELPRRVILLVKNGLFMVAILAARDSVV